MRIEIHQGLQAAIDCLTRRAPHLSPASSLRLPSTLAPGEQVRTFILGDDIAATTLSLKERRSEDLEPPSFSMA